MLTEQAFNYLTELEDFRAKVYDDGGGVMTIGYGHTRSAIMPTRVTQEEAEELLLKDLEYFRDRLDELVDVPLNENQYSALLLFIFNVGEGAFKRSTMRKYINGRDFAAAGKEFHKWDKQTIKGLKKRRAGLTKRRAMERVLWDTPPTANTYKMDVPPSLFVHMFNAAMELATNDDPKKRDRSAAAFTVVAGVGKVTLETHVPTYVWNDAMHFVDAIEASLVEQEEPADGGEQGETGTEEAEHTEGGMGQTA